MRDLHDENVIRTPKGAISVIDNIIKVPEFAVIDDVIRHKDRNTLFSKGPKLSKKEREILREEVMKNNNLYGKNKPIESAFTANNFYIYNNFGNDDFSVIRRIKIEGNEDLINYLSNIVQNETYTNTRSITAIIREFRSRQKQYNSSNGNVKGERGYNATNGDLDLRQSSERGADNAEGNRNERQTTLGRGYVKK